MLGIGYSQGLAGATNADLFIVKTGATPTVTLDSNLGGTTRFHPMIADKNTVNTATVFLPPVDPFDLVVSEAVPGLITQGAATVTDVEE